MVIMLHSSKRGPGRKYLKKKFSSQSSKVHKEVTCLKNVKA